MLFLRTNLPSCFLHSCFVDFPFVSNSLSFFLWQIIIFFNNILLLCLLSSFCAYFMVEGLLSFYYFYAIFFIRISNNNLAFFKVENRLKVLTTQNHKIQTFFLYKLRKTRISNKQDQITTLTLPRSAEEEIPRLHILLQNFYLGAGSCILYCCIFILRR